MSLLHLNIADQNEMFVTEHLVPECLPELLKDFLTVGKTTQERDILLLSALTTLSSAFPKLYMRYGHTGKVYYTNLQTFIMAGAASGKGIANLAQDLVRPIHEAQPLLIPGDSTYPAFYEQKLGSGFHATIIRNGVTLMRIAGILSLLRQIEDGDGIPLGIADQSEGGSPQVLPLLECREEDFRTAVVIATKLLHHAAEAYQMIGGTEQMAIPEQKNTYQKETFFAILPEEFTTGEFVENAQKVGISERSAKRWVGQWADEGKLLRIARGNYQKIA